MRLIKLTILAFLITNARAQIIPGPGALDTVQISGTVTEYSGMLPVWIPLEGARVILSVSLDMIMGGPGAPVPYEMPLDTAYADKDGNFGFKDVVTGSDLKLTASHKGYHDSTASIYLSRLKNPEVTVSFTLHKITAKEMCVVTGRVLEKRSGSQKNLVPVPDALVSVTPDIIVPLGWEIESYSDMTDSNGNYEIIAVVTTTPDFIITASKQEYRSFSQALKLAAGETLTMDDIFLEPQPVLIPDQNGISPTDITLRAWPNPFSSGICIEVPEPRHGLVVSFYDLEGRAIFTSAAGPGLVWQGQDRNGRTVPKGTYIIILHNEHRILSKGEILYR